MIPDETNGPEPRTPDEKTGSDLTPDEVARLQAEVEALRAKLARVELQRDLCSAELERVLKEWIPLPPSEAEMTAALGLPPGTNELAAFIAELERGQEQP